MFKLSPVYNTPGHAPILSFMDLFTFTVNRFMRIVHVAFG